MSTIKKVWITKHDGGMVSISLQSEHIEPKGMRINVEERFGKDMHKVLVGLLNVNDLNLIAEAVEEYLEGEEL